MAPPHWYVYVEIRRLPVSLASDLCGEPRNCVGNSFADFRKILDGAWSLRLRQYQLRLHAIRFDGGDLTRENDEPAKEHHAGQRLHIRQRVMQDRKPRIRPLRVAGQAKAGQSSARSSNMVGRGRTRCAKSDAVCNGTCRYLRKRCRPTST